MTWLISNPGRMQTALLICGDILWSILSLFAAIYIRFGSVNYGLVQYEPIYVRIILFVPVVVMSSFFLELYNQDLSIGRKEKLIRIFGVAVSSFILLSALFFMTPLVEIGRGVLFISLSIFFLFQGVWHITYEFCVHLPGFAKRILVLGTGPAAERIGNVLAAANHHYVFAGYINCTAEPITVPVETIVGNGDGIMETIQKNRAQKIVVSLSEKRGVFPIKEILKCKLSGIDVLDAPSFYERTTGKLLIEDINPSWFIFSDGFRITAFKKLVKRFFDIVFSFIGLVMALPLIPVIALFIKVDSPGPVFYRQERFGEKEKRIMIYKFRTMRDEAEKESGPVWAQEEDPRITAIGRILRKTRLDELPQLYNVLKGEMSFIGPRPERPEFVEELTELIPYYSERHFVKPGITGWAQVRYSYGASVEDAIEKLRYDLYYIKNLSISLDLLILIETVKVVLFGRGGR